MATLMTPQQELKTALLYVAAMISELDIAALKSLENAMSRGRETPPVDVYIIRISQTIRQAHPVIAEIGAYLNELHEAETPLNSRPRSGHKRDVCARSKQKTTR